MRRSLPIALIALALASTARAQSAGADVSGSTNACFGFAFGRWDPPLDWKQAGHETPQKSAWPDAGESQDGGRRQWASDETHDGKVEMVLYPAWWPVGVRVSLAEAGGDTLRGVAYAFVADGRAKVPTAKVAALRVPCGQPNAGRPVVRDDPPPVDSAALRATRKPRRPAR